MPIVALGLLLLIGLAAALASAAALTVAAGRERHGSVGRAVRGAALRRRVGGLTGVAAVAGALVAAIVGLIASAGARGGTSRNPAPNGSARYRPAHQDDSLQAPAQPPEAAPPTDGGSGPAVGSGGS